MQTHKRSKTRISDKKVIIELLSLLKGYKREILFIAICLFFSTVFNLSIPLLNKEIMDKGFIERNFFKIVELAILIVFIYIIDSAVDVFREKKRIEIWGKVILSLSEKSYTHLMKIRIEYFQRKNHTEIYSNINNDIENIASVVDEGMFFLITQIFSMFGGMAGLLIISYKLAILVLVFIPCKYFMMKWFARIRKNVTNQLINEQQNYSRWFGESIEGIREVKLFNLLSIKQGELSRYQKTIIETKNKLKFLDTTNNTVDIIMVQFLIMIIYIIGAKLAFDSGLSIGSIFAFITYSAYVTNPISSILNIGYKLSDIIPSARRFYEFMNISEEQSRINSGKSPKFGDLEFYNVSFGYSNKQLIMQEVYFDIKKGSKTALIGRNGVGKSTIIALLTRMYRPQAGSILLDGEDIEKFLLDEYRALFSLVTQQIYLFNDTIRNNICLFNSLEEEEILEAISDSGLDELIGEVTLDYIVGQNGSLLSGGQKQKVALARALIQDKPIIIFDEVASSADAYSEMQVNNLLHTKLKDKTVLMITHKKKILKNINNIIFLENGKAIHGTYDDLYINNSAFRAMMDIKEKNSPG